MQKYIENILTVSKNYYIFKKLYVKIFYKNYYCILYSLFASIFRFLQIKF